MLFTSMGVHGLKCNTENLSVSSCCIVDHTSCDSKHDNSKDHCPMGQDSCCLNCCCFNGAILSLEVEVPDRTFSCLEKQESFYNDRWKDSYSSGFFHPPQV